MQPRRRRARERPRGGNRLVVHFGGGAGADWVGYQVTQNASCTTGCFIPSCHDGQYGCFALWMSGGVCSYFCSDEPIDPQACDDVQQACLADEPVDGTTGMGEDDGLDETGGGESTGGPTGERYECSQWQPEALARPMPGEPFGLPQALVDELIRSELDALATCEGLRLRRGEGRGWIITKMHRDGLLGALGLRAGDELLALDGFELGSIDALAELLETFIAEDGSPRRLAPGHPGFTLRVRRDGHDFELGLRVVPSGIESPANGA